MYNTTTKELTYDSTGTKTFVIQHPEYENKYLVHACLEGPEAGVYYRGTSTIQKDYIEIKLPSYVQKIATELTVLCTPIENEETDIDNLLPILRVSKIKENSFKVFSNTPCDFNWLVIGKRETIKIEVDKKDILLKGFGPYKYIE